MINKGCIHLVSDRINDILSKQFGSKFDAPDLDFIHECSECQVKCTEAFLRSEVKKSKIIPPTTGYNAETDGYTIAFNREIEKY